MEQILNNINTGIITFDHDFLITSCNEKASDILNISKEIILNIPNGTQLLKMFQAYPSSTKKYRHRLLYTSGFTWTA
ncbi:PAS domain-containing protein [Peribacillus muralis]|uniref:PAS domain-containing protein n=1 Tax=Peribacillus muralis TaxID=264697 RepID=UPI00128EC6AF